MIEYFSGIVPWLLRRANLLDGRLRQIDRHSLPQSVQHHIERQTLYCEEIVDDLEVLQAEPSLLDPAYADQYLSELRTIDRDIADIETVYLPAFERWGDDEIRGQSILEQICRETRLEGFEIRPIIVLYSQEYFSVYESVIYVPRLEHHFMLHLPDLYHEIGHILLEEQEPSLIGDFRGQVEAHFEQVRSQAEVENRPYSSSDLFARLVSVWREDWMIEFTCDLIGAYLCGPAYVWSHFHLTTLKGKDSVFSPSLSDTFGTHPADQARFDCMLKALEDMGFVEEGLRIRTRWDEFLQVSPDRNIPPNFHEVYPPTLVEQLRAQVRDGLDHLNIPIYQPDQNPGDMISFRLNRAWQRFWENPAEYADWEGNSPPI
jgi:hypothetical protein